MLIFIVLFSVVFASVLRARVPGSPSAAKKKGLCPVKASIVAARGRPAA
jgi:hypothetical protein